MAIITPFQAWRYNPAHVALNKVVTQPYDKITPEMQDRYYQADPHNLVQIILGRQFSGDSENNNVYTRAATSFREWRQTGVLRQDPTASLYAYSQTFTVPGTQSSAERRGLIALGRLEDYSAGIVFRHELTHSGPKVDRLNLLRATRAHFGQIFMLYDGNGETDRLLQSPAVPDMEVVDKYGVIHRAWHVSDSSTISKIESQLSRKKLIIADGHHRYETALNYRNEGRVSSPADSNPAYDSVMVTLVDMSNPGLVILPTHRVVHSLLSFSDDNLVAGARQFFTVEEIDSFDPLKAVALLREKGRAGTALLAVTAKRSFLLHSPKALGTNLFAGLSPRQQLLDVVQLHKCILEGILKVSEEAIRNLQNVSYYREVDEAVAQVKSGKAQAAFLMNPVSVDQMRDVAFAGEVMPQKSTDFFPKMLSGLTIYALE